MIKKAVELVNEEQGMLYFLVRKEKFQLNYSTVVAVLHSRKAV
ncbi:hypothetical protein [Kosmotoga pacifica]|nr:hypothetical protein [Kosmotoga pacifica]